mmetsp:Transcript_11386/g.19126  ORF Transcript_11386/g.19126 Transcript_11386/m.19126 type:complete len:94 (+) Transcript_11386:1398-1679(+)
MCFMEVECIMMHSKFEMLQEGVRHYDNFVLIGLPAPPLVPQRLPPAVRPIYSASNSFLFSYFKSFRHNEIACDTHWLTTLHFPTQTITPYQTL